MHVGQVGCLRVFVFHASGVGVGWMAAQLNL
jgi:hypothetical protein